MSESLAKETPDDECYADGNVEAVESGDEEKARSIDAASIEPKALVVKMGPFVALNANEQRTQENSDRKPAQARFPFTNGNFGKVKRATAGEEEDRVDRREENGQMGDIGDWWPGVAGLPRESIQRNTKNDIATEKPGEKHGFGNQENNHPEFASGRWCALVFLGIVGECCSRHIGLWFF